MTIEEKRAKYVAELHEIAGMVAQSPDGPLRWKQYRLVAIADFLGSFAAEQSPSTKVRQGFVTVPREPTAAMLQAVDWRIEGPEADADDLRSAWSAMVSAALAHPQEGR